MLDSKDPDVVLNIINRIGAAIFVVDVLKTVNSGISPLTNKKKKI